MLKIHHALLCQDAIIDSQTGQISYIKVIDSLKATGLPVHIKGLKLASLWSGDIDQQIRLVIRFTSPSQSSVPIGDFTIKFSKSNQKIIYNINKLPILEYGTHLLEVSGTCENGESDAFQILFDIVQQQTRLD